MRESASIACAACVAIATCALHVLAEDDVGTFDPDMEMPGVVTNADIRSRDLARVCMMDAAAEDELRRNLEKLNLSARAYDRVLRVARTIADLRGAEAVGQEDIMEAAGYRQLDDKSGFMA